MHKDIINTQRHSQHIRQSSTHKNTVNTQGRCQHNGTWYNTQRYRQHPKDIVQHTMISPTHKDIVNTQGHRTTHKDIVNTQKHCIHTWAS
ncbi:hypothetical protein KP79_PYT25590 [Mizuhopecten yessoensis]|uniref:Uncharacterized protein n=1 Tax=Mizuhopecten yessoensis TaxID=6573 RepID=A0A210QS91_MIZYE|nr:hypothetical protein KP79_PYT25590 [Mizuhopecten yessoensis]